MHFQSSAKFTLGVEQEIQLLDPETRDLKACSLELLTKLGEQDKIVAEIFQSMIEVRTGICRDANEVFKDLHGSHKLLLATAESMGVLLASSGSHPFAGYRNRKIFPNERFQNLIDRNQWIARRLVIFGLHVHIGMPDGDTAIRISNRLQRYLPLLLAMSASSPFWEFQDTGLSSCRITVFEAIPTGGHPCIVPTWADFVSLTEKLTRSGGITSLKDIWWDIRPNPTYGTIEIRICDSPHRLDQITALTALVQILCEHLEVAAPHEMDLPEDWWVRENKWRASRHGLDASFIVSKNGETAHSREVWADLKNDLKPLIEKRGYQKFISLLDQFFVEGTCADQQRKVYQETDKLESVVDYVVAEHIKGLKISPMSFD